MNYPLTIPTILERMHQIFPRAEMVWRMPDKSVRRCTHDDIYRRARQLAEALQQSGVKRGDRVATLMWNHNVHIEAYFAVPVMGAVLHTLNLRLSPDDIAFIANHAEDRVLIVDDVLLPLYEKFKAMTKFERVIVVSLTGAPVAKGYDEYEAFLKTAKGNFTYPQLDENEACGMCYTSGTTGRPKGVVYSHRSTVLHSFAIAMPDSISLSCRDSVLPVVPMFHANAWGLPYVCGMVGAKLVMPGPHLDAESVLDLLRDEEVTVAGGVPTVWLSILLNLEQHPGRWPLAKGLRMLVGGSAVPESMIRGFDKFGAEILQGWGMTEMSPLGSVGRLTAETAKLSVDEQYKFRGKQGVVSPFVEIRLKDEEGNIAPWDGESMGEIQVRGPWITNSYYNVERAEDKFTADGWLRTGDVATMDQYGYIKIMDRTKDVIKSGGEWISSVDLENAIMGHPAVLEAAVIALPHPKWQERPLAVVVTKPNAKVSEEELKVFLAERFAKWMVPDGYAFIDAIPRTSTGKFLKTRLREDFKDWKWAQ